MSYPFSETTLVKDVVNMLPKTSDVFKKNRIDFCCGGDITLQEATDQRNLDIQSIMSELRAIHDKAEHSDDDIKKWLDADSESLINHIVNDYHRSLDEELPALSPYVTKVFRVHGGNHAALGQMRDIYTELREELRLHVIKEDDLLFPALLQLDDTADGKLNETAQEAFLEIEKQQEKLGMLLKDLREVTNDFTPPSGACGTFQLVYRRLESLENETLTHIHLENNILFPRFK